MSLLHLVVTTVVLQFIFLPLALAECRSPAQQDDKAKNASSPAASARPAPFPETLESLFVLWRLVKTSSVQQDLELSEDQIKAIEVEYSQFIDKVKRLDQEKYMPRFRAIQKDQQPPGGSRDLASVKVMVERSRSLRQLDRDEVKRFLGAEKHKRLLQIEAQGLLDYGSLAGIAIQHPSTQTHHGVRDLLGEVGVSKQQREDFLKLRITGPGSFLDRSEGDAEPEPKEVVDPLKYRREENEKVLALLTDEQRARLGEILGRPYKPLASTCTIMSLLDARTK